MTRKRWKLMALWMSAVVLAVVATVAFIYQTARAAAEEDAQESGNRLRIVLGTRPEHEVRFRSVRFDGESWVVLEFEVRMKPRRDEAPFNLPDTEWGLREWDVIQYPPIIDPLN